jgi:hypothetical protein
MSQAVARLKSEEDSPYAQEIISFIESSKRGICGFSATGGSASGGKSETAADAD